MNIFECIKRMFEVETQTEPAAPTTEPTTTPKRRSPLKPDPSVLPKPKAKRELEVFIKARESIDEDHKVHPDKVNWIQKGDATINKMLPELARAKELASSEEEEAYLSTIASEEYLSMVEKLEKYTGLKVEDTSTGAYYSLVFQTIEKVKKFEKKYKTYLEEWAVMLPLSLPEFKMIDEHIASGDLKIDAKLGPAELDRHFEKPKKGKLSKEEKLNQALFQQMSEMEQVSDEAIQRRFANLLITGGASNKMFLFNEMKEKLSAINKKLPTYYGILGSIAQLGYWVTPNGIEMSAAQAGSEELVKDGENITIKARAITFPYLVHEVVKGIYEWVSAHKEHGPEMEGEQLEDETRNFIAGPGVQKRFAAHIPTDKEYLTPLIQRYAVRLKPDEIKSVLDDSGTGKMVMNRLIKQAEADWAEYKGEGDKEPGDEEQGEGIAKEAFSVRGMADAIRDSVRNRRS